MKPTLLLPLLASTLIALAAMSPASAGNETTSRMSGSMQEMHNKMMSEPKTGDADKDFAKMMMTHHQGGLDMAKEQLKSGKDPELKKMAQKMINEQQRDIDKLKKWMEKKNQS